MKTKKEKFYSKNSKFSRRTFLHGSLRGAPIILGLPLFDYLLNNNGTALASSESMPTRFGTFFWGLGYGPGDNINHWIPDGSGTDWSIPSSGHGLSPMKGLKDYLTVFSNYSYKNAKGAGHIPQRGISVSASHNTHWVLNSGADGFRRQNMPLASIDALVGKELNKTGSYLYPYLNMSMNIGSLYVGTSSWNVGGGARNFFKTPLQVFNNIFAGLAGTDQPDINEVTKNFKMSVLDGIKSDLTSFKNTLGANDKRRLDQHLEGIRTLENQIATLEGGAVDCGGIQAPNSNYSNRDQIIQRNNIMSDLLVHALACNLTPAFCYEFTPTQCNGVIPDIGLTNAKGVHDAYSHGNSTKMKEHLTFVMESLAVLSHKLKNTPEGDGNLLDHMLMVATSEYAGPHHHKGHPYMFIGKSNGRVRGNYHEKLGGTTNNNAPQVLLTAAHGAGVPLESVGMPATDVTNQVGNAPAKTHNYQTSTVIPNILT